MDRQVAVSELLAPSAAIALRRRKSGSAFPSRSDDSGVRCQQSRHISEDRMSFGTASISGASSANGTQQPPNPFSASGPFANLDLSSQQQSEIKSILSQAKSQGLSRSQ